MPIHRLIQGNGYMQLKECRTIAHPQSFLRRSAAEALLIQKPEFQTIKCPVSGVRCSEKTGKTPNGICAGQEDRYHSGYFSVDFQGAEKN